MAVSSGVPAAPVARDGCNWRTLNADLTCSCVYDALTLRDMTATNSDQVPRPNICVSAAGKGSARTPTRDYHTIKVDVAVIVLVHFMDHEVDLLLHTQASNTG